MSCSPVYLTESLARIDSVHIYYNNTQMYQDSSADIENTLKHQIRACTSLKILLRYIYISDFRTRHRGTLVFVT